MGLAGLVVCVSIATDSNAMKLRAYRQFVLLSVSTRFEHSFSIACLPFLHSTESRILLIEISATAFPNLLVNLSAACVLMFHE